jgi:hypothetical protein
MGLTAISLWSLSGMITVLVTNPGRGIITRRIWANPILVFRVTIIIVKMLR